MTTTSMILSKILLQIKFTFTYSNQSNWCEKDCNLKICRTCDYEHLCKRFSNFGSLVDLLATGKAQKGKKFFVDLLMM
jgi:hypothetical protein